MNGVPSELAGTTGLWVIATVALIVAVVGRARAHDPSRLPVPAGVTLALHLAHCSEEYATGFFRQFPPLLGLMPWSAGFFLAFNAVWVLVWTLATLTVWRGRTPFLARWTLWFLALVSLLNLVAHPVLAVVAGGYFPGLLTSLPLGLAGGWLALRLAGR